VQVADVGGDRLTELEQADVALGALERGVRGVEAQPETRLTNELDRVLGIAEHVPEPAAAEVPRIGRQILEQQVHSVGVELAQGAEQPVAGGLDIVASGPG
jgi:hypothetical protein